MKKTLLSLGSLTFGLVLIATAPITSAAPHYSNHYHFNPYSRSPLRSIYILKRKVKKNTQNITANAAEITALSDSVAANETEILANLDAIGALDLRVSALENATPNNTTTTSVDCASDSITDAINNAPASGSLQVEITGKCTENVVIKRDDTILQGIGGASISYAGTVTGNDYIEPINSVVTVIGANNIIIKELTLDSSTTAGLRVNNGASVLLKDSTL